MDNIGNKIKELLKRIKPEKSSLEEVSKIVSIESPRVQYGEFPDIDLDVTDVPKSKFIFSKSDGKSIKLK